jgi:hypothetical protein
MTDTALTHTEACICGGAGVVPVDADYVTRQAGKHRLPDGSVRPGLLEALRDSVMPCYDCRPDAYEAWRNGGTNPRQGSTRPRTGGRRKYRRKGGGD